MPEKTKTRAKKHAAKKRMSKGDSYACDVCGLVITVDEACGCVDADIICCGAPMKERKVKVKAS